MKKLIVLGLAILALQPLTSFAAGQTVSTASPEQTFIPKGFDSNDNAQVIVYGRFHDLCHRLAPTLSKVDFQNKKIVIENQIYNVSESCVDMYVNTPYTSVVNLGALPAGAYSVYVMDEKRTPVLAEMLEIRSASVPAHIDNFLYAPVDEVHTVKVAQANTLPIVLKGTFTNSCLSLKEVKVNLTAGNVYDVLPIMAMAGSGCKNTETPFQVSVNLPNFPTTPTLLNIRIMGGQSIERVIDKVGIIE